MSKMLNNKYSSEVLMVYLLIIYKFGSNGFNNPINKSQINYNNYFLHMSK